MITFIGVLVIICCALVIILDVSLSSKLESVGDDVSRTRELIDRIYIDLPHNLNNKLNDINDHLTTEIACLATKNNEDIKRMGGKFEEWDLIEVEGKEFVIVKFYTNSNGDSMVSCMGSNGQTYNYYKERLADAKFIMHIESPFEEG